MANTTLRIMPVLGKYVSLPMDTQVIEVYKVDPTSEPDPKTGKIPFGSELPYETAVACLKTYPELVTLVPVTYNGKFVNQLLPADKAAIAAASKITTPTFVAPSTTPAGGDSELINKALKAQEEAIALLKAQNDALAKQNAALEDKFKSLNSN